MSVPNAGVAIAQFTSHGTPKLTHLMLGFVPDFVLGVFDHTGTDPDLLFWFNTGGQAVPAAQQVPGQPLFPLAVFPPVLSQWGGAAHHILLSGSSGITSRLTTGIAAYFGGDTIAADNTIATDPTHVRADGTFAQAGEITAAGISIPANRLVASSLNIVVAWRMVPGISPAGF